MCDVHDAADMYNVPVKVVGNESEGSATRPSWRSLQFSSTPSPLVSTVHISVEKTFIREMGEKVAVMKTFTTRRV